MRLHLEQISAAILCALAAFCPPRAAMALGPLPADWEAVDPREPGGSLAVTLLDFDFGDESEATIVVSGDVQIDYVCVRPDDEWNETPPPFEETVESHVSTTLTLTVTADDFIPVRVPLTPPDSTINCPSPFRTFPIFVLYDNITISAISGPGFDSRRLHQNPRQISSKRSPTGSQPFGSARW